MAVTKWDMISETERAGLEATPCRVSCTGCGEQFTTEGGFARHFVLPDTRYLNVGECPNTERGKAFTESGTKPDFYKRMR